MNEDDYKGADEADRPDAIPLATTGEAKLREDMIKMIRNHYVGSTGSRLKAEKLADKLLELMFKHYTMEASRGA